MMLKKRRQTSITNCRACHFDPLVHVIDSFIAVHDRKKNERLEAQHQETLARIQAETDDENRRMAECTAEFNKIQAEMNEVNDKMAERDAEFAKLYEAAQLDPDNVEIAEKCRIFEESNEQMSVGIKKNSLRITELSERMTRLSVGMLDKRKKIMEVHVTFDVKKK